MPAPPTTGKIVFVGNIPYGLTEEQITEIFTSAGRVLSFRLVYDRETGRPKGFGFAEYPDAETAASAVRNLDNHEIMGRKLRVDFSHEGNASELEDYAAATASSNTQPAPGTGTASGGGLGAAGGVVGGGLPVLPAGVDIPSGLNAPDAISRTLKTLTPPQLLDILAQMKTLVTQDPMKATELLRQAPQLSYAIFQALLLMNLVDTSVLTQVIENAASGSAPAAAQPPPVAAPVQVPPPVIQAAPTPAPQAAYYGGFQAQDPQRAALIQQVMSLTQEQIGALPVEQQQQILLLKHQFMAGGGF
ncbi:hypothetical protein RUND412_004899 [Rhizina undulata]